MKAFDAYNLGYRSGLIGDNMPAEADDASLVELDRMQAGWLTGRGEYLETSNNHLGGLVSYLLRTYPDDHCDESTKEMLEAMRKTIPLERLGAPIDCTGTFLYLASGEMSAYVTGQIIEVNGGQLMP